MTKRQQGIKVRAIESSYASVYAQSTQQWGVNEPQHSDAEQTRKIIHRLCNSAPGRYRTDERLDLPSDKCKEKVVFIPQYLSFLWPL